MARTGKFGKRPRPVQSLTSIIIAISREMQAQRDRNIVEAWRTGGEFEGHQVTDDQILAYWKSRLDGLSKKDPLYDAYRNAFIEYTYAIKESVTRTQLAQGKISLNQAANFYLQYAKKVPRNSEFWRILQRDAAELLRQAKAQAAAEQQRRLDERYQKDLKTIWRRDIKPAEYMNQLLVDLATYGSMGGGAGRSAALQQGGRDIRALDARGIDELLAVVNNSNVWRAEQMGAPGQKDPQGDPYAYGVSDAVLFHDRVTGQPVTGKTIQDHLATLIPGFNGVITLEAFNEASMNAINGYRESARAARRNGRYSDATKYLSMAREERNSMDARRAIPLEQSYIEARADFIEVANDPRSSAQEVHDARMALDETTLRLAQRATDEGLDLVANQLLANYNHDPGATTLFEDWSSSSGASASDIASWNVLEDRYQIGQALVASGDGSYVYTTGEWDSNNVFRPGAGGSQIGPATRQDILNNSGGIPTQTMFITDGSGNSVPVEVMGSSLKVHAYYSNGDAVSTIPGVTDTAGVIYQAPNGGGAVIEYSDGKGGKLYSNLNDPNAVPWGGSAQVTQNASGGWDIVLRTPASEAELAGSGFIDNGDGTLSFDPTDAMLSTDKEHKNQIVNAGGDPATDFRSPNTALYAFGPDSKANAQRLSQRPEYVRTVDEQTHFAVGDTPIAVDETGRPTMWDGKGAEMYNRATRQNENATSNRNTNIIDETLYFRGANVSELWSYDPFTAENAQKLGGQIADPNDPSRPYAPTGEGLSLHRMSGTDFESMGSAFVPGTFNINREAIDASHQIRLSGSLKVPSPTQDAIAFGSTNNPLSPTSGSSTGTTFGGGNTGNTGGSTEPKPPPPPTYFGPWH